MEVEGEWLWITAGHVLKAIEESFAAVPPETVGFLDDLGGTNDLPCGPFDWKSATKFYVDDDPSGVDIGFVTLSLMYREWFRAAGCTLLSESDWSGTAEKADALFLVGLPFESFIWKGIQRGAPRKHRYSRDVR